MNVIKHKPLVDKRIEDDLFEEVTLYLDSNTIYDLCKIICSKVPNQFVRRVINKLYRLR